MTIIPNPPEKDLQRGIPCWLMASVIFALLAAVIVVAVYLWQFSGGLSKEHEIWGQFGDYVGGILNPLFALTALLSLLYTIVLQSRELRESTEQLKRSAAAIDAQTNELARQSFEATFFQLLELFTSVVRDLHVSRTEHRLVSTMEKLKVETLDFYNRRCLEELYNIFINEHISNINYGNYVDPVDDAIDIEYRKFYEKYGHLVGHYFRTIYNVVKFVDRSSFAHDAKMFYTNLLRAQLSKYELGLLAYNCISSYGRAKFLPLVREYDLLKHIESSVISVEHRALLEKL